MSIFPYYIFFIVKFLICSPFFVSLGRVEILTRCKDRIFSN
nr:MAG TPA: hypothetical protein [Caudoviricetes sp.]